MAKIPPPPGQLIDIGGHRLHLHQQGDGAPPVLLEAGLGDFSLTWTLVQPEIARFTTVYSYDRAGLGWSDPSPAPRTASAMVDELHTLRDAAGIDQPVVLVAHSFGGLIARLFAHRHPHRTAGLVLVDGAHEDQDDDAPASLRALQSLMHDEEQLYAMGAFVPPGLPEGVPAAYQAFIDDGRSVDTMVAEMLLLEESRREVRAQRITSLGDIPIVALRHGIPVVLPPAMGIPSEDQDAHEVNWQRYQDGFARLSTRGRIAVAEGSSHMIMHERPDAVVDAVRQVLGAIAVPAA